MQTSSPPSGRPQASLMIFLVRWSWTRNFNVPSIALPAPGVGVPEPARDDVDGTPDGLLCALVIGTEATREASHKRRRRPCGPDDCGPDLDGCDPTSPSIAWLTLETGEVTCSLDSRDGRPQATCSGTAQLAHD